MQCALPAGKLPPRQGCQLISLEEGAQLEIEGAGFNVRVDGPETILGDHTQTWVGAARLLNRKGTAAEEDEARESPLLDLTVVSGSGGATVTAQSTVVSVGPSKMVTGALQGTQEGTDALKTLVTRALQEEEDKQVDEEAMAEGMCYATSRILSLQPRVQAFYVADGGIDLAHSSIKGAWQGVSNCQGRCTIRNSESDGALCVVLPLTSGLLCALFAGVSAPAHPWLSCMAHDA